MFKLSKTSHSQDVKHLKHQELIEYTLQSVDSIYKYVLIQTMHVLILHPVFKLRVNYHYIDLY